MKGISPLIATVLLIAVTMSIAGILAFWASSFVREQTRSFENSTVSTECQYANFNFYSCSYDPSTGTMSFILQNLANVELKSITASIIYQNGSVSYYNLNASLPVVPPLKSFTILQISSNYNNVFISTNCPQISTSSDCR